MWFVLLSRYLQELALIWVTWAHGGCSICGLSAWKPWEFLNILRGACPVLILKLNCRHKSLHILIANYSMLRDSFESIISEGSNIVRPLFISKMCIPSLDIAKSVTRHQIVLKYPRGYRRDYSPVVKSYLLRCFSLLSLSNPGRQWGREHSGDDSLPPWQWRLYVSYWAYSKVATEQSGLRAGWLWTQTSPSSSPAVLLTMSPYGRQNDISTS